MYCNATRVCLVPLVGLVLATASQVLAQQASPEQALSYEPIQPGIDYDKPTGDEVAKCKVQPEKNGKTSALVVLDPQGRMLRRFADSTGDNRVNVWCYFKNGVEVYRDIDSDKNKKADQYRWFHTGGTRWAIDKNEDGKIDSWKQISPYEVAEVAVQAMRTGDRQLFTSLLPTSSELRQLGLGKETFSQIEKEVRAAEADFARFASQQKVVTSTSRFLDFGASRPSLIPEGTDGSTEDVVVYDNAAALVDNAGKPEQVYLGTMVQVGSTWKLLGLPQTGEGPANQGPFALATQRNIAEGPVAQDAPSEEMQKLMTELEKLDMAEARASNNKAKVEVTKKRADILERLARMSNSPENREVWQRQQADMLSAAVQMYEYTDAIKELKSLGTTVRKQNASKELISHVEFRLLWAEYGKAQLDPKADYGKVQKDWLESLEKFAKDYPDSPDTAEAMLQLGMSEEFAGEEKEAVDWYKQLASKFPRTTAGRKATGAIRRLDSIGKVLPLKGEGLDGRTVDLASYRRKVVLIHYWATWCGPCKDDMEKIKELYPKYARNGFEVVGVNLDGSADAAREYLTKNRLPWKHIYDQGGLDGELGNELGVMTLPLMMLVDQDGKVVNRNLHIAELENELKRHLR